MSRPDPSFLLSAGVDQAVQRVLAVAFGNNYVVSSSTIGIFLYVALAVESVLAVAFGTHTSHKEQPSMPLVGFEPTFSTGEWAVDRPATGTGVLSHLFMENKNEYISP